MATDGDIGVSPELHALCHALDCLDWVPGALAAGRVEDVRRVTRSCAKECRDELLELARPRERAAA